MQCLSLMVYGSDARQPSVFRFWSAEVRCGQGRSRPRITDRARRRLGPGGVEGGRFRVSGLGLRGLKFHSMLQLLFFHAWLCAAAGQVQHAIDMFAHACTLDPPKLKEALAWLNQKEPPGWHWHWHCLEVHGTYEPIIAAIYDCTIAIFGHFWLPGSTSSLVAACS